MNTNIENMQITHTRLNDKQLDAVMTTLDHTIIDSPANLRSSLLTCKRVLSEYPYAEKLSALYLDGYIRSYTTYCALCSAIERNVDKEQPPLMHVIDLSPVPPDLDDIDRAIRDGFTYAVYHEFINSVPVENWVGLVDFRRCVERGELTGNEFEFTFR